MKKQTRLYTSLLALTFLLSGCESVYYSTMEKVGIHKRDILIDRVEETKESQEESQEEFQSALDRVTALIDFKGGDLQNTYNALNDDYQSSLDAANEVSENIDKVEDVANALFAEWSEELKQYKSASLKRQSSQKLTNTERQFNTMLRSMRNSESKMQPVLSSLNDNVLYLKHNLNAQAMSEIKGEFTNLKRDIQQLVNDMNQSIADSNKFIEQMNSAN
ncbi:DUF2959 domain-containing protein [Psychromonas sp. GE-S-Ul-11]|uniref:DUF2959 domain-containing protein n=1 Tax=unclassified Psychromonas TaxID=2614957 RepID=UPI00390C575E